MWASWYASTIALGFIWLAGSTTGSRLSLGELIFAAIPVGTIASSWSVFFASCLTGSLSPFSIFLGTFFLAALAATRARKAFEEVRRLCRAGGDSSLGSLGAFLPLRAPDIALVALQCALAYVVWPLYNTRMIPEQHGFIWSGGSCYGDLPIHMQISNSFIFGCNTQVSWSGMVSPIFSGERMMYPFLPDFHAAIVVVAGGTLCVWSYSVLSAACSTSLPLSPSAPSSPLKPITLLQSRRLSVAWIHHGVLALVSFVLFFPAYLALHTRFRALCSPRDLRWGPGRPTLGRVDGRRSWLE